MSLRPLLAALVLFSAGLAGCASSGQKDAPAAALNVSANSTPLVDDGTKSLNASAADHMASMPHMHDYWKGKERVTLFDGDLDPNAENTTFATLFQAMSGSAAAGGMQFYLPDGVTVYEGTGTMELTASWSDPRVTGVSFVYQSAESHDYKTGGALPNGKAFPLPVTPAMCDMPHAKVSKWWFGFGPDKSPGALAGPWHLKIEIVRLRDIMLFPAHPDFWQGKTNLTMLDAEHHGSQVSYAARVAQPLTRGDFQEDWVNLTGIVPSETKAMKYTFTITAATSTPGQVDAFGLFYKSADVTGDYRCAVQPLTKLPATLTWIVPVTADNADSPYAKASQWRFLLEPQASLTGQDPAAGGMTNVDYTYHATITATDLESPDAKACRYDAPAGSG